MAVCVAHGVVHCPICPLHDFGLVVGIVGVAAALRVADKEAKEGSSPANCHSQPRSQTRKLLGGDTSLMGASR